MATRAPFRGPQQRDGLADAAHGRHGAEGEGLVPVGVVEVLEPPGTRPDGVHQDVQRSPALADLAEPAAMEAGSVMSTLIPTASGLPRDSQGGDGVVEGVATPRHDGDPGPVRGEHLGHGPSHPLAPTGHDRRRVSESQIHADPPPSFLSLPCPAPACHRQNRLLTASRRASSVARRSSGVTRRVAAGTDCAMSENGTRRVVGTGAVSVRTQRRMIGPALWPAVSSQLATPGSSWAITARRTPSSSTAAWCPLRLLWCEP